MKGSVHFMAEPIKKLRVTPTIQFRIVQFSKLIQNNRNGLKADGDASVKLQAAIKTILSGGQPFVVFRIFVYCNDFKPRSQMFGRESVWGCYLHPLGLPFSRRKTVLSIRTAAIAPPGVSTKNVLHTLNPDIM